MDFILKLLTKAAEFMGLSVPDVVNDDMGAAEPDETAAERTARFKDMVTKEEAVKVEVEDAETAIEDAANDEDAMWDLIDTFLTDGKKVMAIKTYREMTGDGLKEAKDAVDAYIADTASFEDEEEVA